MRSVLHVSYAGMQNRGKFWKWWEFSILNLVTCYLLEWCNNMEIYQSLVNQIVQIPTTTRNHSYCACLLLSCDSADSTYHIYINRNRLRGLVEELETLQSANSDYRVPQTLLFVDTSTRSFKAITPPDEKSTQCM